MRPPDKFQSMKNHVTNGSEEVFIGFSPSGTIEPPATMLGMFLICRVAKRGAPQFAERSDDHVEGVAFRLAEAR